MVVVVVVVVVSGVVRCGCDGGSGRRPSLLVHLESVLIYLGSFLIHSPCNTCIAATLSRQEPQTLLIPKPQGSHPGLLLLCYYATPTLLSHLFRAAFSWQLAGAVILLSCFCIGVLTQYFARLLDCSFVFPHYHPSMQPLNQQLRDMLPQNPTPQSQTHTLAG